MDCSNLPQYPPIYFLVLPDNSLLVVVVHDPFAAGAAHLLRPSAVTEDSHTAIRYGLDIAHREQQARNAIAKEALHAAAACADDRHLAAHRLERGQPEALVLRQLEVQVRQGDDSADIVLPAQEVHAVGDALLLDESAGGFDLGTGAHEDEARGHPAVDAVEDLDDIRNALDRSEVGNVHEYLVVRVGETVAADAHLRRETRRVDEVRDNRDFLVYREPVHCLGLEVLRHRRHTVRLLDGEARDVVIGRDPCPRE